VKSLRILLTGGSSGIGAATAKVLTEAGHRVSVLARNTESLERVARACPSDRIRYEKVDVTDEEAVKKTVQAAINEWGGIDVCIPNAGLGIFAPLKDASLSDWKTMVDVNIGGVLNTLHACLPSLVENKGHVIQIGSIAARNVFPNSGIYCATKHAVLAISESLNPGAVDTSFIDQTKDDELRENYRPQFEQGMQPEFIADAIAFAIASGGRGVFSEMTMRPDRR
jgi:NADP-dependent 3-hydroxy acid dehydrogenase YdfG